MNSHLFKRVLVFCIPLLLAACVTTGNTRFLLQQDFVNRNYSQIKAIVVEEASNNGFGALTSEVKPSEFNNWSGRLFFQLKTANGTDQLFVNFRKVDAGVDLWIHGAGTRSNPDSAAKAIQARISKLNDSAVQVASPVRASLSATQPVPERPLGMSTQQAPAPVIEQAIAKLPGDAAMSNVEAQRKLIALGYLKGSADGIFGKNSVAALKRFQQAAGIEPSGTLSAETSARLRAATK